jgi:predicted metal-dependent HD superfamily phosphohydrolase
VVTLEQSWAGLLPGQDALGAELLGRWSEPHRRYHDTTHLAEALDALGALGGTARVERLAIWFHDAVHTGRPGHDETASAELAAVRLAAAGLGPGEVAEVHRLVLVTIDHAPARHDPSGARVSDADIAILGAEPDRYLASVAALREELTAERIIDWRTERLVRLAELLSAEPLFHTDAGRRRWHAQALANLTGEQRALLGSS